MKKVTFSLLALAAFPCAAHVERVILEEELAPVEQAVDSVAESVGDLSWATSELHTRWSATNLSQSAVNRVPTNGWPASDVTVHITMGSMTNLLLGIPGGWEPEDDRTVTFRVIRSPSSGFLDFYIGTNSVTSAVTNGSQRYNYEFKWVSDSRVWLLSRTTLGYVGHIFNTNGKASDTLLVDDGSFPPVIDETDAPKSLSLSKAPASPAEQLALPDGVVVMPVSDGDDDDEPSGGEAKQEESKDGAEEKFDVGGLMDGEGADEPEVELKK